VTKRAAATVVFASAASLVVASPYPAASAATRLTFAVTPSTVANGGVITVTGTAAPCVVVMIRAHPGALGVTSLGPIEASVHNGRYSTSVRLPRFVPDPSRPGVNAKQFFTAICAGTTGPVAMATIAVTGTELPRTGSNALSLSTVALGAVIIGAVLAAATKQRRPSGDSIFPG
jgi:hypothetical protein